MPDPQDARRVTYPLRAWIAFAVFAVLMCGILAAQLVTVRQQKAIQVHQEDLATRLNEVGVPVLRDSRVLVEDAVRRREEIRAAAHRADALVRETRPLVGDLRDARAGQAIAQTGQLATELRRAHAAGAIAEVGNLAAGLARGQRLVELTDRATRLIAALERAGTVGDVDRMSGDVRQALAILRQSLSIQTETLAVQREALQHIRSLDQKTGGPLPTAAQRP
jgi:hypothetical protein